MTFDSILFDAGSLFFAALIVVIAGISLAAFGGDLFPSRAHLDPTSESASTSAESTFR
jgi:hypothetical protein